MKNETQLQLLASRLRERSEKDMALATSKCSEQVSFMYVMGRAQTLKIIAEELEALEGATVMQSAAPYVDLESLRRRHGRDCQKLDAYARFHGDRDRDVCSCGADEHNAKIDNMHRRWLEAHGSVGQP
jgi:hypothetical protein